MAENTMVEQAKVSVTVTVAWGEMDSFNHVNNIVYLRWFESARIRLFERLGLMEEMRLNGIGPILARSTCDYLLPVSYPDTVIVDAWCTRIGRSSFDLSYAAHSEAHGDVCARGDSTIVMVDYGKGGSVALTEPQRSALAALSGD